jgi:hypothetical protein
MKGLLALPPTGGTTFYQPCHYCKQATKTIISPDAILKSNNNLNTWIQIGHKGDTSGSIQFSGSSPKKTLTLALTKHDGLYYCPTECVLTALHAEILGDPYSKKSPLPSIGEFPSVCHPTYSRLPSTWPTTTSVATHYTQQPP